MLEEGSKYREYLFSRLKSYGETEEALLGYINQGLKEYCWTEDNEFRSLDLKFLLFISRKGIYEIYLDLKVLETK